MCMCVVRVIACCIQWRQSLLPSYHNDALVLTLSYPPRKSTTKYHQHLTWTGRENFFITRLFEASSAHRLRHHHITTRDSPSIWTQLYLIKLTHNDSTEYYKHSTISQRYGTPSKLIRYLYQPNNTETLRMNNVSSASFSIFLHGLTLLLFNWTLLSMICLICAVISSRLSKIFNSVNSFAIPSIHCGSHAVICD